MYFFRSFLCRPWLPRKRTQTRRMAPTLSYEDFIETYALRGRPVILKGGASLCFGEGRAWDREAFRREAEDKVGPSGFALRDASYMEDGSP